MRSQAVSSLHRRRSREQRGTRSYPAQKENSATLRETLSSIKHVLEELPDADNEPGAVNRFLELIKCSQRVNPEWRLDKAQNFLAQ
jgi:hypothetical protein